MTPNQALARSLPCEDPEEPCDADGRDEHRWCDNCIARSVVARSKLVLVEAEELERLRRLDQEMSSGVVVAIGWHEPGEPCDEYQRHVHTASAINWLDGDVTYRPATALRGDSHV